MCKSDVKYPFVIDVPTIGLGTVENLVKAFGQGTRMALVDVARVGFQALERCQFVVLIEDFHMYRPLRVAYYDQRTSVMGCFPRLPDPGRP